MVNLRHELSSPGILEKQQPVGAGATTNVDGQVQCCWEPGDSRGVALTGRCVLNLNNPYLPFSIRVLKQSDGTTMGLIEEKVIETSHKDIYIKP